MAQPDTATVEPSHTLRPVHFVFAPRQCARLPTELVERIKQDFASFEGMQERGFRPGQDLRRV